jgi:hypothetical protein
MFGNILSEIVKIATLPVDAVNIATDIIIGGDGSKESRINNIVTGDVENFRDKIAETLEDIDD